MKRIWMSLLVLALVLSLIGCGSQTAQSEASSPAAEKPAENTAQEEANGADNKPQTGMTAWHYVLTTDKRTEEKKNAEGVLLAETRYELPKLTVETLRKHRPRHSGKSAKCSTAGLPNSQRA